MAKLKKKVKKQWVEALRSGKYKQGKGALGDNGKYCCLGVLCEVAIESGLPIERNVRGTMVEYDDKISLLPPAVYEWATLKKDRSSLDQADFTVVTSSGKNYLASLNDSGISFSEIADLIEASL